MLEIMPNKTTADIIREMNDVQLVSFLTRWDGGVENLVFTVYRALKYKYKGGIQLQFNRYAEEAMKDVWLPNGELDLARFDELS